MTEQNNGNLNAALLRAQQAIESISKDAKNAYHNFSYASAEAVITEVRKVLHAEGILLRRGGREITSGPCPVIRSTFHVVHVGSGESITETCDFLAVPHDGMAADRAVAAALTSCLSYYLRDLLLLPRVDDMNGRNDTTYSRQNQAPAATPSGAPISSPATLTIESVSEQTGANKQTGKTWLRYHIKTTEGIEFTTFDSSLADGAKELQNKPAMCVWEKNKYGHNLKEIGPAGPGSEFQTATVTISEVKTDAEQTEAGTTRPVYGIITADGTGYRTYVATIADWAGDLAKSGKQVVLRYKTENGKRIVDRMDEVQAEAGQESGDNLPF